MSNGSAVQRILVLASGSGTNAENLIRHFYNHSLGRVCGVLCDRPDAGVLHRAWNLQVSSLLFARGRGQYEGDWQQAFAAFQPDWIVLAGWLQLIPASIIAQYPNRIINLHPSLLPKYGGKGMYGIRVHEAVIAAGDDISGITIHYVNPRYDEGPIIHQERINVHPSWQAAELQTAIQKIEHRVYPEVIERLLESASSGQ